MKRFILFGFDDYYPSGGMLDSLLIFNEFYELEEYVKEEGMDRDNYQILYVVNVDVWAYETTYYKYDKENQQKEIKEFLEWAYEILETVV